MLSPGQLMGVADVEAPIVLPVEADNPLDVLQGGRRQEGWWRRSKSP